MSEIEQSKQFPSFIVRFAKEDRPEIKIRLKKKFPKAIIACQTKEFIKIITIPLSKMSKPKFNEAYKRMRL